MNINEYIDAAKKAKKSLISADLVSDKFGDRLNKNVLDLYVRYTSVSDSSSITFFRKFQTEFCRSSDFQIIKPFDQLEPQSIYFSRGPISSDFHRITSIAKDYLWEPVFEDLSFLKKYCKTELEQDTSIKEIKEERKRAIKDYLEQLMNKKISSVFANGFTSFTQYPSVTKERGVQGNIFYYMDFLNYFGAVGGSDLDELDMWEEVNETIKKCILKSDTGTISVISELISSNEQMDRYKLIIDSDDLSKPTYELVVNHVKVRDVSPLLLTDENVAVLYEAIMKSVLNAENGLWGHCAAGIGRTGEYALAGTILLATIFTEDFSDFSSLEDIFAQIERIRDEVRPCLIQTASQAVDAHLLAEKLLRIHLRYLSMIKFLNPEFSVAEPQKLAEEVVNLQTLEQEIHQQFSSTLTSALPKIHFSGVSYPSFWGKLSVEQSEQISILKRVLDSIHAILSQQEQIYAFIELIKELPKLNISILEPIIYLQEILTNIKKLSDILTSITKFLECIPSVIHFFEELKSEIAYIDSTQLVKQ